MRPLLLDLFCGAGGAAVGYHRAGPDGTSRGVKATSVEQAREVMGIDWMEWPELTQAIPPVFTEYIGAQLLDAVKAVA